MASDWGRYEERKFLLPPGLAGDLQRRLTRGAVPDSHSGPSGYQVASLYFDTWGGQCAAEKLEGEFDRYKLRLRAYRFDAASAWGGFHLEVKSRQGSRIGKRRQSLIPSEAARLACHGLNGPVVDELLDANGEQLVPPGLAAIWAAHASLRPVVLVIYRRSAFQLPGMHGLRLTFDRDVTAHAPRWPLPDEGAASSFSREALGSGCIFEAKAPLVLPRAILQIMAASDILETSCSKFLLAWERLGNGNRGGYSEPLTNWPS